MNNNCDYIIVQAGGKGTRMKKLTRNKPKALVPINNLPMIFHLFKKFPNKKYIIIGDYKYDVLKNYLREFANVEYSIVCATGKKGTCAGLQEALSLIPANERFMLIWCDIVLPEDYKIPNTDKNIIGLSKDFPCRWKYKDGLFIEEQSSEFGVAGHFIFSHKAFLRNVPEEGEFVRWLQTQQIEFEEQKLYKTHEYGLIEEWDKLPKFKCRPFNSIQIEADKVFKEALDEQGEKLARREIAWYKAIQGKKFKNIPQIYSYAPLCMEYIDGNNIYEYRDLPNEKKRIILSQIVQCLKDVHNLGSIESDKESFKVAYFEKTFDRLKKVRFLVPFANDEFVVVNGVKCRNVFYYKTELERIVNQYFPAEFKLIHGDCTFSNMLLKKDGTPVLIDPRGYFGTTELFGDVAYDWVKLYYSLFSNYDQFNLKRFDLMINDEGVELSIDSNNWEELENDFFDLVGSEITKKQMKILLSIIWLSLTTYAWEDYDSICGAFYNGLYYFEEAMKNE